MNQPTDKQKQEAQELLRACEKRTGIFLGSGSEFNDFAHHVALALSSRDQEIREVLEGLRDDNCFDACFLRWIKRYEDPSGFQHSDTCLATRRLWERVQGG